MRLLRFRPCSYRPVKGVDSQRRAIAQHPQDSQPVVCPPRRSCHLIVRWDLGPTMWLPLLPLLLLSLLASAKARLMSRMAWHGPDFRGASPVETHVTSPPLAAGAAPHTPRGGPGRRGHPRRPSPPCSAGSGTRADCCSARPARPPTSPIAYSSGVI